MNTSAEITFLASGRVLFRIADKIARHLPSPGIICVDKSTLDVCIRPAKKGETGYSFGTTYAGRNGVSTFRVRVNAIFDHPELIGVTLNVELQPDKTFRSSTKPRNYIALDRIAIRGRGATAARLGDGSMKSRLLESDMRLQLALRELERRPVRAGR